MSTIILPTEVKVGWKTFKIGVWDHHEAEGRNAYGYTNFLNNTIKIDTTYDGRCTASTLLHEILHAAYRLMSVAQRGDNNEEHIVTTLGDALSTIFVDNPQVMAWIMEHIA